MLTKLLSLLIAGKGGAFAAATIVAGATTVSVMTTSPEIQDTLAQITSPGMSQLARASKVHDECEKGQPVVVAQRNAADKLLRAAYQDEHKRLTDLRGGKDVDHRAANEIRRTADRELRAVLTTALNDVARETLGREGQVRKADASASPSASPTASASASPTASPAASESASPTPKPSCTPKPSASASLAPSASPTAAASPSGSPAAEAQGRAAVAARVTLNATLQAIVDTAKTDMKKVVDDAEKAIDELPAVERGKPEDKGKPESQPGKAEDRKPADAGKPADRPGGRPGAAPGRP